MGPQNFRAAACGLMLMALVWLPACAPRYAYKENAVPEPVKLSYRLQTLFAKTKPLCFGRYVLQVPLEAELIIGSVGVPSKIEVFEGGLDERMRRVHEDVEKIQWRRNTAEITYNGKGPVDDSWQIRYFSDEFAKEDNSLFFDTYVGKGELTFVFGGAVRDKSDSETKAAARQAQLAEGLRLRQPEEVPAEAGFCIKHGFIPANSYTEQETVSAGLHFPSLPDVTFSISSNKNAYMDYPPAEYQIYKAELSMLTRIEQAKVEQGKNYPSRTLLREGKRDVHHWHGEESLIRRQDGVHDFEWALVGTPTDVAYPAELSAHLYTKVEHNTVGAANSASLSDDEAIALWDRLLSDFKFRVKVPGAPAGSYLADVGTQARR